MTGEAPGTAGRPGGPLVVLIGAPGSGKTTVGRLLARRLEVGFRDTDADVEAVTARSVADLFVTDGEEAFRSWERAAVAAALAEHPGVLALGGGAVGDPGTRELLAGCARGGSRIVWLRVGAAQAAQRVGLARERPVLGLAPRAMLRKLLAEREPLYAAVATDTVSSDEASAEQVAERVLEVLPARSR